MFETQQGVAATHPLESQAQAFSVCLKHSKVLQPLTPGEPSTGILSMLETQQGVAATH
jgi:hypothetical protein